MYFHWKVPEVYQTKHILTSINISHPKAIRADKLIHLLGLWNSFSVLSSLLTNHSTPITQLVNVFCLYNGFSSPTAIAFIGVINQKWKSWSPCCRSCVISSPSPHQLQWSSCNGMTVTALDTALPCLLCYLLDYDNSAQVPPSAQHLMAMLRLAPLFLSFSLTTQSSVYWSMSLSQLDLEPLLVCKACCYPIEGIYAVFLFVLPHVWIRTSSSEFPSPMAPERTQLGHTHSLLSAGKGMAVFINNM